MIQTRRLGYATFETPDIDRQVDYFTQVLGLTVVDKTAERAFLTSQAGQHAVILERGAEARCSRLGLQVAPGSDLGEMAADIGNMGVTAERRSDICPGITSALTFRDLNGLQVEVFTDEIRAERAPEGEGIRPLKLGHIAFAVPDPKKTTEFYCNVLGFRVSDWMEDFFAFLRCSPDHHTVNFVRGKTLRLHHIAFELKDWDHVHKTCEVLGRKRIPIIWGPGRHGLGHNIFTYHRNADDQVIECFTELDLMLDEALGSYEPRPWHRDNPQKPKVWKREDAALIWGPPPTADFLRNREQ
jgi:catechol 2,3-dioxygenase-like lactoylglutathione lyase family enzyme